MFTENYYLILSKTDGRYLAAKPKYIDRKAGGGYLLMFREQFEALSYLNTHAGDLANRFAVESVSGSQLKSLLHRWGFIGVGMVRDPLVPQIDFLIHNTEQDYRII